MSSNGYIIFFFGIAFLLVSKLLQHLFLRDRRPRTTPVVASVYLAALLIAGGLVLCGLLIAGEADKRALYVLLAVAVVAIGVMGGYTVIGACRARSHERSRRNGGSPL